MKHGWFPRTYAINIPKAFPPEDIWMLCTTIEEIKDGIIQTNFGGDYSDKVIPDSHVLVFSNSGPDLENQSRDRWKGVLGWKQKTQVYASNCLGGSLRSLL